jgi:hypothetical protein
VEREEHVIDIVWHAHPFSNVNPHDIRRSQGWSSQVTQLIVKIAGVWALKTPYCSTEYTRTSVSNCDHIMGVFMRFLDVDILETARAATGPHKIHREEV